MATPCPISEAVKVKFSPEDGTMNSPDDRIATVAKQGDAAQLGAMAGAWLRIPQSEQWPNAGIIILAAVTFSCLIGTAIAVTT